MSPSPPGVRVKGPWRPFKDPAAVWLNAEALPMPRRDSDSEGTYYARRAVEFLRDHRNEPFCLFVSFKEPHSPFDFPLEYAGRHRRDRMPLPEAGAEDARWMPGVFAGLTDNEKRGIVAAYYTSVEYMDANVGRVLEGLESLGLADSTLVIYASDNGYLLGHHGRFEKHMMWEEAVRVPLLVRHDRFRARATSDAFVELVDLVPTITDSLGLPPMAGVHGRTLVPLLEGRTREHREFIFSEYLPDNKAMIRTRDWKYIYTSGPADLWSYETGHGAPGRMGRLYDMRRDPAERTDMAGREEHAAVVDRLQRELLRVFYDTDPRAPRAPKHASIEDQLDFFLTPPERMPTPVAAQDRAVEIR